jgi:hypothetical protein
MVRAIALDQPRHGVPTLRLAGLKNPGTTVGTHPPQLVPVIVVVVDENGDARVCRDVDQPAQRCRTFGFRIDGAVDRVAASAKTIGTRCGRPLASAVASRATRACAKRQRACSGVIRR